MAGRCESVHFDTSLQCEDVAGHSLSARVHSAWVTIPPRLPTLYLWRDDEAIDNSDVDGAYVIAEVLERNRSGGGR